MRRRMGVGAGGKISTPFKPSFTPSTSSTLENIMQHAGIYGGTFPPAFSLSLSSLSLFLYSSTNKAQIMTHPLETY
jgi:hypothetical protein